MRLIGAIDADSLSTHRPRIDRVEVHRPKLSATRLADGRWNVAALLPPPPAGDNPAPMHVYDATLVLADATKPGAEPLTLRNVNLMVKQAPPSAGAAPGVRRVEVEGRAEDSLAQLVAFGGAVDSDGGNVDFKIDITQLGVTTNRLLALPGVPPLLLVGLNVSAKLDARATIKRQSPITALDWKCDFRVQQGQLSHPLIPKAMADVEVSGDCDPTGVRIAKATAKSGEAELTAR